MKSTCERVASRRTSARQQTQRIFRRLAVRSGLPGIEALEERRLLTTPTLTVTANSFTAHFEKSFKGTVATFTTTDLTARASDFQVTINWGDNTTTSGKVKANKHEKGEYTVTGSHKYDNGISGLMATITVTENNVTDVALPDFAKTDSAGGSITTVGYADALIEGSPFRLLSASPSYAQEGVPVTDTIGLMAGALQGAQLLSANLTIEYPDGTSETVPFQLAGLPPAYHADASGVFKFTDTNGNNTVYGEVSGVFTYKGKTLALTGETGVTFIVSDEPLTAYTPPNQTAPVAAVAQPLAAHLFFLDDNSAAAPNQYTGSVNWGDDNQTNLSSSNFKVVGKVGDAVEIEVTALHSYSYQGTGSFPITATINDEGGETVQLTTTATVENLQLQILGLPNAVLPGQPIDFDDYAPPAMATFFAGPGVSPDQFIGTINWGDGTTSQAYISYQYPDNVSPFGNTIRVDFMPVGETDNTGHIYSSAGDYTVTLTIESAVGQQVLASGTIREVIGNP